MRGQRDLYAHMNNQVLHLANNGVTINQVQNVYAPPKSLQQQWYARGYHGSMEHNSRAVINRYLGYWDANPTTLIPLSPEDSAPLYVEMMGGADNILAKGQELYDQGKYREAQEILNKLVYAEPVTRPPRTCWLTVSSSSVTSRKVPVSVTASWQRLMNCARESPTGISPKTLTPDVINAMTTEMFLDFLGILVDSPKADGINFRINLVIPDESETHLLEMSNATLTNISDHQAKDANLTLTVNKVVLMQVMMGAAKLTDLIESGAAKAEGDLAVLGQLKASMGKFEPLFEIMPGTKMN